MMQKKTWKDYLVDYLVGSSLSISLSSDIPWKKTTCRRCTDFIESFLVISRSFLSIRTEYKCRVKASS